MIYGPRVYIPAVPAAFLQEDAVYTNERSCHYIGIHIKIDDLFR